MKQQIIDSTGDYYLLIGYVILVLLLAGILYLAVSVNGVRTHRGTNKKTTLPGQGSGSALTKLSQQQHAGHEKGEEEEIALM